MNVVVASAFRDSSSRISPYLYQVSLLQKALGPRNKVRVLAMEGDSADDTRRVLSIKQYGVDVTLKTCNHGGPWFGSVVSVERMTALSKVANAIFDALEPSDEVLVYVENDLLWAAETIEQLIHAAVIRENDFDVLVPMVMAEQHRFYDVWAFRAKGEHFSPYPPYHPNLEEGRPLELDSAGSCLVMRADVARACRVRDENCLVGWCQDARDKSYRIGLRSDLRVEHP